MIRYSCLIVFSFLLFAACKNGGTKNTAPAGYDYGQLEGRYRGDFGGGGDILIALRHVTDRSAVGFDLHKGLRRNFSGTLSPAEKGFKFVLHEPGDNKFDGIFEFMLDTTSFEITGTWKPANMESLGKKNYTLKKLKHDSTTRAQEFERVFADSIGELHFQPEGLCIYRYYPKSADGSSKEQYQEIKGNWKMTDHKYIVDWQKNNVFATKQSIFKTVGENSDNYFYNLAGEGRDFYAQGE